MSDDARKRESIARVARQIREHSGGKLTQEAAERRVAKAVRKGDLKRANNNR